LIGGRIVIVNTVNNIERLARTLKERVKNYCLFKFPLLIDILKPFVKPDLLLYEISIGPGFIHICHER
jgi:hypothetical protein